MGVTTRVGLSAISFKNRFGENRVNGNRSNHGNQEELCLHVFKRMPLQSLTQTKTLNKKPINQ